MIENNTQEIIENSQNKNIYNGDNGFVNKTSSDVEIWSRFLDNDFENAKFEIVIPGNSLSLEDWKQNNNESEKIKIFFERFCGYYINVVDFGIVKIAKLSIGGHLDRYLILQTVSLTDIGFVEGEKFILDDINVDDVFNYISFQPDNNRYRFYLTYYPKDDTRNELYNDRILINNRYDKWDSFNNFFTKNIGEIGAIVKSIFSIETQRKYTGKFIFQEYEYLKMHNVEDTDFKEKIEQKIITVDIDENGYLLFTGIPSYENFFIGDYEKRIGGYVGDGTITATTRSCYFLNEYTIIDEYEYWLGDDGVTTSLEYKVKYVKTDEIYE
jgi:hypothetical protein